MIYAIRAVGTEFVKIGRAKSVGKRMKELETGCPHELHIEAVADWPDPQESAIHQYLSVYCQKYEWFIDSERTAQVIKWLQDGEAGLRQFRVTFLDFSKLARLPRRLAEEYEYPSRKPRQIAGFPRVDVEPTIEDLSPTQEAHERFESIKQRTIARKAAHSPR